LVVFDGAFWLVSYMTLAAAVVNGEGQEKELTKYHVRETRKAPASAAVARQVAATAVTS